MVDKIVDIVGRLDYRKGLSLVSYVELKRKVVSKPLEIYEFYVESESKYNKYYNVNIIVNHGDVVESSCDCPQYEITGSCKHLAACLIKCKKDIFVNKEENDLVNSKKIIDMFYKKNVGIRKQVNLDIDLIINEHYYNRYVEVKIKIGIDKMYSLNNKLSKFIPIIKDKKGVLEFGKNFTFNYDEHFFNEDDERIINYLVYLDDRNPYYNLSNIFLKKNTLDNFLSLLTNKEFFISKYGKFRGYIEDNPYNFSLSKNNNYELVIKDNDVEKIIDGCSFVIYDKKLYKISDDIKNMLATMEKYNLKKLEFRENDLESFTNNILPLVKDKVKIADDLRDKIIIGNKPDVSLYIDYYYNAVVCSMKLKYGNKEINYFDNVVGLVRDEVEENNVVTDLLKYNFIISNKRFIIEDMDDIGEFINEDLVKLASDYRVFSSEKVKETRIVKPNVKSAFSIGADNIMSYNFDLGDIDNSEILDVLDSLRNKKKYYRLKSGDIINMQDNDELEQLDSLINDMELSKKDINSGSGEIPKYRAIYLDSLKKDKYNIITTNNLFNDLIDNFNKYKDIEIDLNMKDKKILRGYQVVGVKWLYNIYKCGFGGILADEMGLGKSIQLIYFIKEILREKSDSKILVVAPTSLIYNWKAEFDKFGNELRYKVFSENKKKREEDLHNIDDINILITTYGLIRQDKEIYQGISFELIAIDEAQNIKNINAQMTKIIKRLKANTKIALTGTPLENNVTELWSIFDFIMPGYLTNVKSFNSKYNIKDVDEDNLNKLNTLIKQIQPFILRRKKKDVVLELPDKIENNIFIDLGEEQMKLYAAQVEKTKKEVEMMVAEEGFKKARFKILQLLTRLRQICIDPSIIFDNYKKEGAKIAEIVRLVEEIVNNNHKILIFTSFKTALDIVNKKLINNGISTYVIDGSVSAKKRMELVDKFNNDDTNVFLITLKAGGTGLNLTSADVVIHADLWWNPQVENQATDRAHRIGQVNTVEVIKLVCKGTIEEKILELQKKKKILTDALIEGEDRDKNIISSLSEKDIKNLLTLDND